MVVLDRNTKKSIVEAIQSAERRTSGEIRVHLQTRCRDDVFWEAKKVFSRLKMQRTKERNGVLVFVALKSRQFSILGDIGIHRQVGDHFWTKVRDKMQLHFAAGRLREGLVEGIRDIGEKLAKHFPCEKADRNELSDTVTGG